MPQEHRHLHHVLGAWSRGKGDRRQGHWELYLVLAGVDVHGAHRETLRSVVGDGVSRDEMHDLDVLLVRREQRDEVHLVLRGDAETGRSFTWNPPFEFEAIPAILLRQLQRRGVKVLLLLGQANGEESVQLGGSEDGPGWHEPATWGVNLLQHDFNAGVVDEQRPGSDVHHQRVAIRVQG